MHKILPVDNEAYRIAMGRLLVMYTQIDYLIMCACAERITTAPDDEVRLKLGKQVGDESRHVRIQQKWMKEFGTETTPVFSAHCEQLFLQHFRNLDWIDFLTDMYVCVEALGSEAVEQVVPLADPGTRESLRTPLQDEMDHVAFGLSQLKKELSALTAEQRHEYLGNIPARLDALHDMLLGFEVDVTEMFTAVGADFQQVIDHVTTRRDQVLQDLSMAQAA